MAKIVWTEPALDQLNEVADYIFIDNPLAAKKLVTTIFETVDKLNKFPELGAFAKEIQGKRYRQLTIRPCKIFYKFEGSTVYILYVRRFERSANE